MPTLPRAITAALSGLLLLPAVSLGVSGSSPAHAQAPAAQPAAAPVRTVYYSYEAWSREGDARYLLVPKPVEVAREDFANTVRGLFKTLLSQKRASYGDARISFPDDVEQTRLVYVYLDESKAQYHPIVMAETVYTFTEHGAVRVIFPKVQAQGWTRAEVPFPAYVLAVDLAQALPPAQMAGSLVRTPDGALYPVEVALEKLKGGDEVLTKALWQLLDSPSEATAQAALRAAGLLQVKDREAKALPKLGSVSTQLRSAALDALVGVDSPKANAAVRKVMEGDAETALRDKAAAVLSKSSDPAFAVAAQFHALKSADAEVAKTAAEALGESKVKEAGEVLVQTLGHAQASVREAAVQSLAKRGDVKALTAALEDAKLAEDTRTAAAVALSGLDDKSAKVRGLAWLAANGQPEAARGAVEVLARLDQPETYPALGGGVKHKEEGVRGAAVAALVKLGKAAGLGPLAQALGSHADTDEAIEQAMQQIYSQQDVDLVLKDTKHKEPAQRKAAVGALGALSKSAAGQRHKQAILETLNGLYRSEDAQVRAAVARSYGDLDAKQAVENLRALSKDDAVEVQRAVAWALGQVPGEETQATLLGYVGKEDAGLKANALRSLGVLKLRAGLDPAVQHLKHDDVRVRRAATQALAQIGETLEPEQRRPMLSYFSEQVFDSDAQVRLGAVAGLGLLKDSRTVTAMASLLQDQNVEVRIATLAAIAKTQDATAGEALATGLDDDLPRVRAAAAKALGDLGNPGGVKRLELLLEREKDTTVIEAAKAAIAQLKK